MKIEIGEILFNFSYFVMLLGNLILAIMLSDITKLPSDTKLICFIILWVPTIIIAYGLWILFSKLDCLKKK